MMAIIDDTIKYKELDRPLLSSLSTMNAGIMAALAHRYERHVDKVSSIYTPIQVR